MVITVKEYNHNNGTMVSDTSRNNGVCHIRRPYSWRRRLQRRRRRRRRSFRPSINLRVCPPIHLPASTDPCQRPPVCLTPAEPNVRVKSPTNKLRSARVRPVSLPVALSPSLPRLAPSPRRCSVPFCYCYGILL